MEYGDYGKPAVRFGHKVVEEVRECGGMWLFQEFFQCSGENCPQGCAHEHGPCWYLYIPTRIESGRVQWLNIYFHQRPEPLRDFESIGRQLSALLEKTEFTDDEVMSLTSVVCELIIWTAHIAMREEATALQRKGLDRSRLEKGRREAAMRARQQELRARIERGETITKEERNELQWICDWFR